MQSLLGATEKVTLPELRRRDFLDTDNVHLSFGEKGKAAAALYAQDTEAGCESEDGETEKDGEEDQHASWSSKTELFP